jgi:hypothetical protein
LVTVICEAQRDSDEDTDPTKLIWECVSGAETQEYWWLTVFEANEEDAGVDTEEAGTDTLALAGAGTAGYSSGSRLLTSSGSFWYHSGLTSPVGCGNTESEGTAVLKTESTERRVGSMVLGSMARAARYATSWAFGSVANVVATSTATQMIRYFMFLSGG